MQHFDDLFSDALNQEPSFPPDERNWQKLSGRLDAYEAGAQLKLQQKTYIWKIATAAAASVALVLAWKVHDLQSKHHTLQAQLEQSTQAPNIASDKTQTYPEPYTNNAQTISTEVGPINTNTPQPTPNPTAFANSTQPARKPAQGLNSPSIASVGPQQGTVADVPPRAPLKPEKTLPSASGYPAENKPLSAKKETPDIENQIVTNTNTLFLLPTQKLPSKVYPAQVQKQAPALVLTKLAPTQAQPSRFSISVLGQIGEISGKKQSFSLLRGTGIQVACAVSPSIQFNAGIDWLQYELNSTEYLGGCSLPKEPKPPGGPGGPGGGPHVLKQIEAAFREQRLSIGTSFRPQWKTALKPVIQAAYVWTHRSPALVTFRFEDDYPAPPNPNPGPDPKFFSIKAPSVWNKNMLRLGAGLEYDAQRWTLGIYAQHDSEMGSNDKLCDVLLLKAGVQYRL
jgi:hypothetical protein